MCIIFNKILGLYSMFLRNTPLSEVIPTLSCYVCHHEKRYKKKIPTANVRKSINLDACLLFCIFSFSVFLNVRIRLKEILYNQAFINTFLHM